MNNLKNEITVDDLTDKECRKDIDARSYFLICGAMIILVIIYSLFWFCQIGRKLPLVLGTILSFCLLFILIIFSRNCKFEKINACLYLSSLIIGGMAYCFLFTPFSVPDEVFHYSSSYCYSNFLMGKGFQSEDPLIMREVDAQFLHDGTTQMSSSEIDGEVIGLQQFDVNNSNEVEVFTNYDHSVSFNLPQEKVASALGITLARIMNLGPYWLFYLGRLFNLFQFVCLVYIGYRIIPFGKSAYVAVSLLPMTLHLAGSYSYDSFIISMSMLLTSLCFRAIGRTNPIKAPELIGLGVCIALLAPCKVVYSLLSLLVLLIPGKRFETRKTEVTTKCLFLALPLLIVGLIKLNDIIVATNITSASGAGNRGGESVELYTVGYFQDDPLKFVLLVFRTFETFGYFYLQSLVGGSLGWFQGEIAAPHTFVVLFVLILCFSTLIDEGDSYNPSNGFKLMGIVSFIMGILLVMLTMLLSWTPAGEQAIQGVQGRYFIPYLVWTLMSIRSKRFIYRGDSQRAILTLLYFANTVYLIRIVSMALTVV